jgi:phosphatidylinositol-bisphosphatase
VYERSPAKYDRIFWCGDLNYRINGNRRIVENLVNKSYLEVLLNNDQLYIERKAGRVFRDFVEGELRFNPTYKYDVGPLHANVYDTSEKRRIPAWTDRVLWMPHPHIEHLEYGCCESMRTSDHRPVYASFRVHYHGASHQDESDGGSAKSKTCSIM